MDVIQQARYRRERECEGHPYPVVDGHPGPHPRWLEAPEAKIANEPHLQTLTTLFPTGIVSLGLRHDLDPERTVVPTTSV